jgi:hypothetical protein
MEFVPPQCADDPTHNVIVTLPGVFQAAATGCTYTDSDASDESDWYGEVLLAWPTAQHGRLIEDYLEADRSTVTDQGYRKP